MVTLRNETLLVELTGREYTPGLSETAGNLRLVLSEAEIVSYHALETIWWESDLKWDSLEDKLNMVEAFASPLYETAAKEYFAAAHLGNSLILSMADRFLTEEIIFSFFSGPRMKLFGLPHFVALMGSEHLSERIILAAFPKTYPERLLKSLSLVPDAMIAPAVVSSWMLEASKKISKCQAVAVLRIKKVYPEYEGFPDDWVLKVFCGK